jgi:HD-like signal output (HDOD) protein
VPVLPTTTQRPQRAPTASEAAIARDVPPTLAEVLESMIADLGGPVLAVHDDVWRELAAKVAAVAESMPPPPSFPRVATQVLTAARDPEVDINELVGLVQRDAAIASALVRIANSPAFAPAVPISSVRGAIQSLGIGKVVEVAVGTAGRSYYDVASEIELALFPALWQPMFNDAMATAFSAGRLALDVPASRGECALLAGLLADVGRPIALRILCGLVRDGLAAPSDPVMLATLDEVAPAIGAQTVAAMNLPDELRAACLPDPDRPAADAVIARLIAAIGAVQRRGPGMRASADEVSRGADQLKLNPYVVRSLFAQRSQHLLEAAQLFGN